MSTARARRLLTGIRFHHLGFGFFWAVSFIVLSGLQSTDQSNEHWRGYLVVEQVITFLAVGGVTLVYRKKMSVLPSWLPLVAGFALSGGALLYFLAFHLGYNTLFIVSCAGFLIGSANALFFLLWQTFFVTEGQQRAIIYIPLSAVLSILLYVMTLGLPLPALIFVSVVGFPFIALFTLHKSLDEIELFPITMLTRQKASDTIQDLWRPIFCVCAIGFVWKLVAQISGDSGDGGDFAAITVLIGFGAAATVVAVFELFSTRGFEILRIYQILFPLITGIFLLPSFFGTHYSPVVTGMLMFGFEIVNLLLLVTCAVYAAKHQYSPVVMYGICVFPVLIAMSSGDILGSMLTPLLAYDFTLVINALFVCVYFLSLVLILVSRGRKSRETIRHDEPAMLTHDGSSVEPRVRAAYSNKHHVKAGDAQFGGFRLVKREEADPTRSNDVHRECSEVDHSPVGTTKPTFALTDSRGLSPREIEVADLLVRGNSVAAISRKLFISENTTRGHTKSIYRKLDIHSRQELVDMMEENS